MQDIEMLKEEIQAFNQETDKMIHNMEVVNRFLGSGQSIILGKREVAALCGMSEESAMAFLNSKEVQSRLFDYGQGKRISIFNLLKIRSIGGA